MDDRYFELYEQKAEYFDRIKNWRSEPLKFIPILDYYHPQYIRDIEEPAPF